VHEYVDKFSYTSVNLSIMVMMCCQSSTGRT